MRLASVTSLFFSLLSTAALTGACAVQPDDATDEPGDVSDDLVVVTPPPPCNEYAYVWTQGAATTYMMSASDYVCVLSGVAGHFAGDGERVTVTVDGASGRWVLTGQSQQSGVYATAECFQKSCFWANGADRWTSDEFTVEAYTPSPYEPSVQTWWGDAVTYISSVGGKWDSTAQAVSVYQSTSAYSPSSLNVAAYVTAPVRAAAHAFFAGTPSSGRLAQFQGPYGTGSLAQAGVYYNDNTTGRDVNMTSTSSTMCVLNYLSGQLLGGGDTVYIYPGYDSNGYRVWKLHASSGSGRLLRAYAACYRFDQR